MVQSSVYVTETVKLGYAFHLNTAHANLYFDILVQTLKKKSQPTFLLLSSEPGPGVRCILITTSSFNLGSVISTPFDFRIGMLIESLRLALPSPSVSGSTLGFSLFDTLPILSSAWKSKRLLIFLLWAFLISSCTSLQSCPPLLRRAVFNVCVLDEWVA